MKKVTSLFTLMLLIAFSAQSMNKAELIEAMASGATISGEVVGTNGNGMQSIKKGDRVALVGFGSFSISNRAARKGRNPQTGKEIKIAANHIVSVKGDIVVINHPSGLTIYMAIREGGRTVGAGQVTEIIE